MRVQYEGDVTEHRLAPPCWGHLACPWFRRGPLTWTLDLQLDTEITADALRSFRVGREGDLALARSHVGAIGLGQHRQQTKLETPPGGVGRDGQAAAPFDGGHHRALGRHANANLRVGKPLQDRLRSAVVGAAFNAEGALPDGWKRDLGFLQVAARGGLLAVDDLAARYPELADSAPQASGALFLPLDEGTDNAVLWFRPEFRRSVFWGGNPDEHAIIDPATAQLAPRRSFAAWKSAVAGRAAPWSAADLLLAREFRDLYVIEQARRASASSPTCAIMTR